MDPIPLNPDASQSNGNQQDIDFDNQLRDLFTDGSGIVRASCSYRNLPGSLDTHYQLANGTVHTFHVFADERASRRTGLYVPLLFPEIEWVGNSTVVATNPVTQETLNFYHVRRIATLPPRNALDSRCIGEIGGPGADRPGDFHAHGTLFKNRESRDSVEVWKNEPVSSGGFTRDINKDVAEHVRDVRSLIWFSTQRLVSYATFGFITQSS